MILEAKNACKQLTSPTGEEIAILSNISLSFQAGSSTALVGASGSGKTTLLSLLAGLDAPTSGTIFFKGKDLSQITERERTLLRRTSMGFIFQNFQLIPNLTALQNVTIPLELEGKLSHQKIAAEAKTQLVKVGLGHRISHYPSQLSGGEQQRIGIARAIVHKPEVLFADEPTGNLDTATGESIRDLLYSINKELSTTLILVTHSDDLAKRADAIVRLKGGSVAES